MKPDPDCIHCADFTRAGLLRQGFATAGRGLPGIETGMPTPAGTGLTRRSMLLRSTGLAMTVFGASALTPSIFDDGIARAAAAAAPTDPILVSIFMSGGVDSLSVLAPVDDPIYISSRPTLRETRSANPLDIFTEDTRLQWHSSAAPLRDLHLEGKVTVMPGIGWSGANGSHFHSRHFWELGELNFQGRVGWLGRYLDREGDADNPLQGLALGNTLAPALATSVAPVAAVLRPENYPLYWSIGGSDYLTAARNAYRGMGRLGAEQENEAISSARRAAVSVSMMEEQLAPLQGTSPQSPVAYPDGGSYNFPRQLATVAQMIDLGLPLRCVALEANGGYDTHSGQAGSLSANLSLASRSILAFQRDLEARGLADRVLIHVWSEFGRRVKDNGSGTDHGAGGISFVIGSRATGQMVGEFPGLTTLDSLGNLRTTTDFRGVYSSLLEQWLGTEAEGIIPGASNFARPQLVA